MARSTSMKSRVVGAAVDATNEARWRRWRRAVGRSSMAGMYRRCVCRCRPRRGKVPAFRLDVLLEVREGAVVEVRNCDGPRVPRARSALFSGERYCGCECSLRPRGGRGIRPGCGPTSSLASCRDGPPLRRDDDAGRRPPPMERPAKRGRHVRSHAAGKRRRAPTWERRPLLPRRARVARKNSRSRVSASKRTHAIEDVRPRSRSAPSIGEGHRSTAQRSFRTNFAGASSPSSSRSSPQGSHRPPRAEARAEAAPRRAPPPVRSRSGPRSRACRQHRCRGSSASSAPVRTIQGRAPARDERHFAQPFFAGRTCVTGRGLSAVALEGAGTAVAAFDRALRASLAGCGAPACRTVDRARRVSGAIEGRSCAERDRRGGATRRWIRCCRRRCRGLQVL